VFLLGTGGQTIVLVHSSTISTLGSSTVPRWIRCDSPFLLAW
jgi:hypothetical protein